MKDTSRPASDDTCPGHTGDPDDTRAPDTRAPADTRTPSDAPIPADTRTSPDRPADASAGRGSRHRAGTRRHRAGLTPPAILGLSGPDPGAGPHRPRPGVRRAAVMRGMHDPAAGHPGEDDDLAGADHEAAQSRRAAARRRRVVLAALALTAAASAVTLIATLVNWAPAAPPARELTAAERDRLAAMRVVNYRDVRSGLHLTVSGAAGRTDLLGWVDWARRLVYLDVSGPGAGTLRGLAQATPAVTVVRPDPDAMSTPAMPPLVPPGGDWRLPTDRSLDPLLGLIFDLARDRTEPADELSGRWLRRAEVDGETVDVLEASLRGTATPGGPTPAGPPTAEPRTAPGDTARYWLDAAGRLHRVETTLPGVGPVHLRLHRADRPTLRPVDALGGRPGLPRALTAAERHRWQRLPARLRAAGGATVTLVGPVGTGLDLRGAGWVSWTSGTAYLGVTALDAADLRTLVRQDRKAVARIETRPVGDPEAPPPLPPPATGWRTGPHRTSALDPLVSAALRAARGSGPQGSTRRVRGDSHTGVTVDVVEVETAQGPTRYWIDRTGTLRRLEAPTPAGTWAQLDLTTGRVPRLTPRT
ncbi:hypothetical protein [Micromonospora craniellae]|uniref:Uncharacterized protein n=1 Tax=Micromonospora craniellae TaxID=2294034 RepID=A0A372G318_9ACTN|nr:hypothetical protein [Micromonospora craniellae]QOC91159.1 hypothetical protein ID554_24470 [Micromonospora craniellae]RFS47284.1 hypothetical protein D0Q02_06920 [Micromonospora craniellae]